MKKLTPSEISFINNYLKNSGVKYVDIRYEMTDHVATALEELDGDFYDNFKEYMVKHKEQLLKSNKKFGRTARNKAVKQLFGNMISRLGIGLLVTIFFLFYFVAAYMPNGIEIVFDIVPTGLLMAFIVTYIVTAFKRLGKSWSGTDKMLAIINLLVYMLFIMVKPERFIHNQPVLMLYYSTAITFMIMAYISYRELKKKYKLQYNG